MTATPYSPRGSTHVRHRSGSRRRLLPWSRRRHRRRDGHLHASNDGLRYRGYPVGRTGRERATFDEVAYLLLYGDLPNAEELNAFQRSGRRSPADRRPPLTDAARGPAERDARPMDALRTAVSVLAHFDPDTADISPAANLRKAERLLGQIPLAVADQYRFSQGLAAHPPRADLSHAANFL